MATLDEWLTAACRELGVDQPADNRLVLDLARDVAQGVARPAAPLTTFLLGVAVGRGADPAQAATALSELAQRWQAADPDQPPQRLSPT